MNVGSLFSGIGGIELGLERAGDFNTVWFVEKDPYARAVVPQVAQIIGEAIIRREREMKC